MRYIFSFVLFCFLCLVISGCDYSKFAGQSRSRDEEFKKPVFEKSQLSFSNVYQNVLLPKCISCHRRSGNLNLETYQSVLKNLSAIKKSVFETKSMPLQGSLSKEQKSVLWNWIAIGAPENGGGENLPPEIPLAATFQSISKNIFEAKCFTCHSPGNSGQRVLLDKDSLLNSPLELVIPGNSDESGLVVALERVDDKRMPPIAQGYTKLSEVEILTIRQWIADGASQ